MHLNIVAQVLTEAAEWTESHTRAGDLYKVGISTIISTSIAIVRSSTNFINLLHVQHLLMIQYISQPITGLVLRTLRTRVSYQGKKAVAVFSLNGPRSDN